MIDASFEVIENIRKHPDADKLDLADLGMIQQAQYSNNMIGKTDL